MYTTEEVVGKSVTKVEYPPEEWLVEKLEVFRDTIEAYERKIAIYERALGKVISNG